MQDLESGDHVARLKVSLNEALARHVDQQHSHSEARQAVSLEQKTSRNRSHQHQSSSTSSSEVIRPKDEQERGTAIGINQDYVNMSEKNTRQNTSKSSGISQASKERKMA